MATKGAEDSTIDEDVGKLTYTPKNNFQKWREKYPIRVLQKYGDCAKVLANRKHLEFGFEDWFGIREDPADKRQDTLRYELIKMRVEYRKMKPKVFGDMLKHLSETSRTRVKNYRPPEEDQDLTYEVANADSDFLKLWIIIEKTHMTDPASVAAQVSQQHQKILSMRQGKGTHIEAHNENFRFEIEKLENLGVTIDHSQMIVTYLCSLNQEFVEVARKMMMNSTEHPRPKTLDIAYQQIVEWFNDNHAVNQCLSWNKSAPQRSEAAHAVSNGKTQTTGSKGKNSNKNKKSNQKRSNPHE